MLIVFIVNVLFIVFDRCKVGAKAHLGKQFIGNCTNKNVRRYFCSVSGTLEPT